ncbi:putative aspartic peptidase A1 family, xylanase inhibitor [Lupinus albus]|uniref:Putative aspartic peptidase A1 family, xylanase inhibitor n=1 Tax=Lupinus albus TaxID=3870 RepID=A0A6A4QWE7_LUPAL|nr:putative aspartic peptidase A1 family, xylanase inhibitor [Lupinus albus]
MDFNLKGMLLLLFILTVELCFGSNANLVLPVERKFIGPHISLSQIKAHDARRHGRFLSGIDIELGGNGLPSKTGLYYTKIGLGSPAKDYYVQVDTGSDVLWVNCEGCTTCPKKSGLGVRILIFPAFG